MPYGSLYTGCEEHLDLEGTGSFYNEGEADIVVQHVFNLIYSGRISSLLVFPMYYTQLLFRKFVNDPWSFPFNLIFNPNYCIVKPFLAHLLNTSIDTHQISVHGDLHGFWSVQDFFDHFTILWLIFLNVGVSPNAIAVQSPYIAQVKLLRDRLDIFPGASGVEVATIDSFQGREADAVIISMVNYHILSWKFVSMCCFWWLNLAYMVSLH